MTADSYPVQPGPGGGLPQPGFEVQPDPGQAMLQHLRDLYHEGTIRPNQPINRPIRDHYQDEIDSLQVWAEEWVATRGDSTDAQAAAARFPTEMLRYALAAHRNDEQARRGLLADHTLFTTALDAYHKDIQATRDLGFGVRSPVIALCNSPAELVACYGRVPECRLLTPAIVRECARYNRTNVAAGVQSYIEKVALADRLLSEGSLGDAADSIDDIAIQELAIHYTVVTFPERLLRYGQNYAILSKRWAGYVPSPDIRRACLSRDDPINALDEKVRREDPAAYIAVRLPFLPEWYRQYGALIDQLPASTLQEIVIDESRSEMVLRNHVVRTVLQNMRNSIVLELAEGSTIQSDLPAREDGKALIAHIMNWIPDLPYDLSRPRIGQDFAVLWSAYEARHPDIPIGEDLVRASLDQYVAQAIAVRGADVGKAEGLVFRYDGGEVIRIYGDYRRYPGQNARRATNAYSQLQQGLTQVGFQHGYTLDGRTVKALLLDEPSYNTLHDRLTNHLETVNALVRRYGSEPGFDASFVQQLANTLYENPEAETEAYLARYRLLAFRFGTDPTFDDTSLRALARQTTTLDGAQRATTECSRRYQQFAAMVNIEDPDTDAAIRYLAASEDTLRAYLTVLNRSDQLRSMGRSILLREQCAQLLRPDDLAYVLAKQHPMTIGLAPATTERGDISQLTAVLATFNPEELLAMFYAFSVAVDNTIPLSPRELASILGSDSRTYATERILPLLRARLRTTATNTPRA